MFLSYICFSNFRFMKIIILVTTYVLTIFTLQSQIRSVTEEFALPTSLSESSGIIFSSRAYFCQMEFPYALHWRF